MFKILIVEDDKELRELFSAFLSDNGFSVFAAEDGREALFVMETQFVDLVVTDIMMPHMDGYELTRQVRAAYPALPILMITAKNGLDYKSEGFQSGTDDYMVKPVDLPELLWRVKALLRRSQSIHTKTVTLGKTVLHFDSYTVEREGEEQVLPPKEFMLLYKLLASPGRTFTRNQLMDEIWGMDSSATDHTLEVHIGRLRDKCKDNPDFSIVTVRGLGYKATVKENKV